MAKMIPYYKAHWFSGELKNFSQAPHLYPIKITQDNDGIALFRIYHKKMYAVTNPDILRSILLTNQKCFQRSYHSKNAKVLLGNGTLTTNGKEWQHLRKNTAANFKQQYIKNSFTSLADVVDNFLAGWSLKCQQQQIIPISTQMQELSLSMIVRLLFTSSIDFEKSKQFYSAIRNCNALLRKRHASLIHFPKWLPTPANRQFNQTRQAIDNYVKQHILEREKTNNYPYNDILNSFLIDSKNSKLSNEQLYDEIATLFVAGFETNSAGLTWTLYLLAKHPEIKKKWQKEVDDVLTGNSLNYESIQNLKYTQNIIKEVLRLYPPIYNMGRECIEDHEFKEYSFKKGQTFLLSLYGIHRHPKYWKNPDQFIPERYDSDWPKHCYMPFALGRHTCIGKMLAITEITLALAKIAQQFDFSLQDTQEIPLRAQILLVPGREIFIKLKNRHA